MIPSTNPNRGLLAVRTLKCLGISKGGAAGAIAYASGQRWTNAVAVVDSLTKAAITPNDRADGAPLITQAGVDFAEFIRPATLIGRLIGLRRAPARTRIVAASAGATAYWGGEGGPIGISKLALAGTTMDLLTVSAIVVSTAELLRSSEPNAESMLSADLSRAAVQAMDTTFIDPSNAGIPNVKPASVTSGVVPIASSGAGLAAIDSDFAAMVNALADAGSTLEFAAWVMTPRSALYLARLRGTGGDLAFPAMTVRGGMLLGLPALVTSGMPDVPGSPTLQRNLILLDAAQVIILDDEATELAYSEQATLAMRDDPASPSVQTSMFQTNSVALKVTRHVNWMPVRPGAVQILSGVGF